MSNKKTVLPAHPRFDRISETWLDAWFDIVAGRNWAVDKKIPDRRYIERIISEKYSVIAAGLR
jgi:hypothetical protein